MSTQTRKATTKTANHHDDGNPSAAHAEAKGERKGYTSAKELAKVPAELDTPDEVTPTHGVCAVCENPGKLDDDGKLLPHRAHGHGALEDDPICDGTGKEPSA